MFRFDPFTEQEALNLLQPGDYHFKIKEAELTSSKSSGKEMIKLKLEVMGSDNNIHTITDYLTYSLKYKLIHFCQAVGLEKEFEMGQFSAIECIDKVGKCKIIINQPDPGSQYNPKNSVKDYIKRDSNEPIHSGLPADNLDDSIPF